MKRKYKSNFRLGKGIYKNMKTLINTGAVIIVIVLCFSIWMEQTAPQRAASAVIEQTYQLQQNQLQLQKQAAATAYYVSTVGMVWNGIYVLGFLTAFCVVIAVGRKLWIASSLINMGHGQAPLIVVNGGIIDPNKQIGVNSNQQFSEVLQLEHTARVQQTRNLIAVSQGDNGFVRASVMKHLVAPQKPQYNSNQIAQDNEIIEVEPVKQLTLSEALEQSQGNDWIIGQDSDGETAVINLAESPHVGLFGGSGNGKTSNAGMTIALQALRTGYHVVVFDGKGIGDWKKFNSKIEAYNITADNLSEIVSQLESICDDRKVVIRNSGYDSFYEIEGELPFAPLLVVWEELTGLLETLTIIKDKSQCIERISSMLKVCRALGVQFLVIGQAPNDLASQILGNLNNLISYKNNGGSGAAIKAYKLHELQKYEFWLSATNSNYFGFNAKENFIKLAGGFVLNEELFDSRKWIQPAHEVAHAQKTEGYTPHTSGKNVISLVISEQQNEQLSGKNEQLTGVLLTENREQPSEQLEQQNEQPDLITDHQPDHEVAHEPTENSQKFAEKPLLSGEPKLESERLLVVKVYRESNNSKTLTCQKLWGKRNNSRIGWIDNVLKEYNLK